METHDLPPHAPTLMESTRAIGYSLASAIADIIDNSITAQASKIEIDFFPVDEAYIAVIDDGVGMNKEELIAAMRYGSKNPNEARAADDLGRYGLGLKTASLSQCRKLTVITRHREKIWGCCWDLNHIHSVQQWSLQILDDAEMEKLPAFKKISRQKSGTLVLWQDLDKLKLGEVDFSKTMGRKMDSVRQHLALVFHRYLAGEPGITRKEMRINNVLVTPIDPFLSCRSTQIMDDEMIMVRGEKIAVRPYILPHLSQLSVDEIRQLGGKDGMRKLQGFYVYRNKRLLIWGTWFRLMRQHDLSKLARVQVDLPNSLDDLWTLDIKKSTAVPPEEVRKNLATVIHKIAEGSKRTWTYRGKKETTAGEQRLWERLTSRDGGIIYSINRAHPLVEHVLRSGNKAQVALDSLLTQIERSLPLNQLYVDLSTDEKIDNDNEPSAQELFDSIDQILSVCQTPEARREMFDRILPLDPFATYPELLTAYRQEKL